MGKMTLLARNAVCNVTDKHDLMEQFDQFFRLMSLMSDWLQPDTIFISEASLQVTSNLYQVTVQNIITTTLLATGENILTLLETFFTV